MTSEPLKVHRRQFVLGPEPVRPREDWTSRRLSPALWLSCDPELRCAWASDRDGADWALLGMAVETREEPKDPVEQLAAARTTEVPELYEGWAGRWLLVGPGAVHPDATGRLGCLFGADRDGRTWISSSPALLLALLAPADESRADRRPLRYEVGLSWYVPPRTRFAAMSRLLPSQQLDPTSAAILPRPLMPAIDRGRDVDETLELLRASYVAGLRRLSAAYGVSWLALSAGIDSRLVLAMAHEAGIGLTTFTRISPRTAIADRELPPRVARIAGFDHVFLPREGTMSGGETVVAEHSAWHLSRGDAEPFLTGVRHSLEGVSIGGWAPVGKPRGRRYLLPDRLDDPTAMARRMGSLYMESPGSSAIPALREWLTWVAATPQDGLDWRERVELEQLSAGWGSAKEQLYDAEQLERFPLFNAARSHALVLGLPRDVRAARLYPEELIRSALPGLLDVPCNPPDRSFGLVRASATRLLHPSELKRQFVVRAHRAWRRAAWARSG